MDQDTRRKDGSINQSTHKDHSSTSRENMHARTNETTKRLFVSSPFPPTFALQNRSPNTATPSSYSLLAIDLSNRVAISHPPYPNKPTTRGYTTSPPPLPPLPLRSSPPPSLRRLQSKAGSRANKSLFSVEHHQSPEQGPLAHRLILVCVCL